MENWDSIPWWPPSVEKYGKALEMELAGPWKGIRWLGGGMGSSCIYSMFLHQWRESSAGSPTAGTLVTWRYPFPSFRYLKLSGREYISIISALWRYNVKLTLSLLISNPHCKQRWGFASSSFPWKSWQILFHHSLLELTGQRSVELKWKASSENKLIGLTLSENECIGIPVGILLVGHLL